MMWRGGELPSSIPLFPLSGALLLPRGRLPLHIFEPRYLEMLEDVLKTPHRLIGMIQPREGGMMSLEGDALITQETPPPKLHQIGCAGRLTAFSETGDGRYMIALSGISRFRMKTELESATAYRRAEVSWGDFSRDLGTAELDPGLDMTKFPQLLQRYFMAVQLSQNDDPGSLRDAEPERLINSLAAVCPFSAEDKQALLEAPQLSDRREILVTLMEFALRGGKNEDVMQ